MQGAKRRSTDLGNITPMRSLKLLKKNGLKQVKQEENHMSKSKKCYSACLSKTEKKLTKFNFFLLGAVISTLFYIAILLSIPSCSYSIQNIVTEGEAEDVVDTATDQKPTISPHVEIPLPGASVPTAL